MDKLKISVVTVCLNAADTIEKTMLSVLSQTYEKIEYIIMDGQSTDKTPDILRQYEKDPRVRIFSGKDTGLYNAMNKGIDACSGDYVIFLNSGDLFADNQVLENAVSKMQVESETNRGELFYGNVIRSYEGETKLEKYPGKYVVFRLLMMGRMPCHQGIFTGIDTMRKYRFDESYKICADFDFLMRCMRGHVRVQYLDVNVSIVDCVNGISSQGMNLDQMRAEDDRSIRENYPVFFRIIQVPKMIARKYVRKQEND